MEIIVEYSLIDNLVIDAMILYISQKLKKEKINVLRLFLSSLFGAICALFMPLLTCPNAVIIIIKLLIGATLVIIYDCKTFKKFLLDYFVFMSVTALLGGVGFGALYLLFGKVSLTSSFAYESPIFLSAIYIVIFAWVIGVVNSVKYFYRKKNRNNFMFEIIINNKNQEFVSTAYLDSGNTLIDPKCNKPVIVIGTKTFFKLYKNVKIEKLLMKKLDEINIEGAHYIEYNTLNNQKMSMLILPIESVKIKNGNENSMLKDCVLGLSFAKFQKNFGCDILLNQNCF